MKFLAAFLVVFLGMGAVQGALIDDLIELGALFPSAEMGAIIQKYIDAGDAEVLEILDYLKGPEFAALVAEIGQNPKWIALKDYLIGAGVDVDLGLQYLYDLIQNAGPSTKSQTRGAADMFDELMALFPIDGLIDFLNDKLANSPDFIAFWEVISGEDTHQLVEEIRAMPEVVEITARLLEMGIDINTYLSLIYLFLGWN